MASSNKKTKLSTHSGNRTRPSRSPSLSDRGTTSTCLPSDGEIRISCFSRRSQDLAHERVFDAIDEVIEKNVDWTEEQTDRLRRRFREIYRNALHENSTIDGQPWAKTADDLNITQEVEPVDLKLRVTLEEMVTKLDSLMVATMNKRKTHPYRLSHQEGKKLRCLHSTVEQYKPLLEKAETDQLPIISKEEEMATTAKLATTSEQMSALSRVLPDLIERLSRLQEAVTIHTALATNETYQVITKPSKDESVMATSLTPLRAVMDAQEVSKTLLTVVLKRHHLPDSVQPYGAELKRYKPSDVIS